MRSYLPTTILLMWALASPAPSQTPKSNEHSIEEWVNVEFVRGGKKLSCRTFHLEIRISGELVIAGDFQGRFRVNERLESQSRNVENIDVRIRCGRATWVFAKSWVLLRPVPVTWTFGIDYPPFVRDWQFVTEKDIAWIKYFEVNPTYGHTTYEYRICPNRLRKDKSGPCFDQWR